MYQNIIELLKDVIQFTPQNVGIFCASYDVLYGIWRNDFEELVKSSGKKCFREDSSLNATDNDIMIEQFKDASKTTGGVLIGVCGGRNSEGEDFPGNFMNCVVIIGVPFQKPTPSINAKITYYDHIFQNKGRLFAYLTPAMIRANQACGRPLRKMDDRALIFLIDHRFFTYKEYLSDWVRDNMTKIAPDHTIVQQLVGEFFHTTS
jgi:DNA excision repair protein ERCC-2